MECIFGSGQSEFYKNGALKNFGLKACNFIKSWTQHRYFPVNLAKFSRSPSLLITYRRFNCFCAYTFKWETHFHGDLGMNNSHVIITLTSFWQKRITKRFHWRKLFICLSIITDNRINIINWWLKTACESFWWFRWF